MTWMKANRIPSKHTEEFFDNGEDHFGEAIHWYNWGGVDLLFEDGSVATYAIGDISPVPRPHFADNILAYEFDEYGKPHQVFPLGHAHRANSSDRQVCCKVCHACLQPLREVLDGELWCDTCETYR